MKKIIYILTLPLKMSLFAIILLFLSCGFFISWLPLIAVVALNLTIGWIILSIIIGFYLFSLWYNCLFDADEITDYAFNLIKKEKYIK